MADNVACDGQVVNYVPHGRGFYQQYLEHLAILTHSGLEAVVTLRF